MDVDLLTKTRRQRAGASKTRRRRSPTDQPRGEGGPEEAAAFIGEAATDLAGLARRHRLDLLGFLLGMVHLEAEDQQRLRRKRSLS